MSEALEQFARQEVRQNRPIPVPNACELNALAYRLRHLGDFYAYRPTVIEYKYEIARAMCLLRLDCVDMAESLPVHPTHLSHWLGPESEFVIPNIDVPTLIDRCIYVLLRRLGVSATNDT